MRKYLLLPLAALLLFSCKDENKVEEKIAELPAEDIKIERFDKIFFESTPAQLPELKKKFDFLFPKEVPDNVWLEKQKDPFQKQLYAEVQKKYPNVDTLQENITDLYRHMKYYYPTVTKPRVVTLVYDDLDMKCVYTGDLILIPLSIYLGEKDELYVGSMDNYHLPEHNPSQILPDIVTAFSKNKIAPIKNNNFLSYIIYYGKELYMKDMLIPEVKDNNKIGYTAQQMKWTKENETEIWRYFVENKLFYDNDPKLLTRFVQPAPFSKFYLGFDNDTPGRLGQWIGWQIVRSYMEHNKGVKPEAMLAMDAQTIFDNSKYKPEK
ncbi:gliding motility lipoprotein GldB [Flavobacterium sp. RHBU_3]|uniref:gliding motility lipoprotein GldB n=1 Tax=Flavobacterium sp. RHBU_3 TaxID=3391184 RepID=UPI00398547CB